MSSDEDVEMKTRTTFDPDTLIKDITGVPATKLQINTFINNSTGEVPSDLLDSLINEEEDANEKETEVKEEKGAQATSDSHSSPAARVDSDRRIPGSETAMKHMKKKLMVHLKSKIGETTQ